MKSAPRIAVSGNAAVKPPTHQLLVRTIVNPPVHRTPRENKGVALLDVHHDNLRIVASVCLVIRNLPRAADHGVPLCSVHMCMKIYDTAIAHDEFHKRATVTNTSKPRPIHWRWWGVSWRKSTVKGWHGHFRAMDPFSVGEHITAQRPETATHAHHWCVSFIYVISTRCQLAPLE